MIRQRAAEKERYREQSSKPGAIKRMQFTFSIDQPPAPSVNLPVKKPDLKPSPEFTKRTRAAARAHADEAFASTSTFTAQATTTTGSMDQSDDMVVDSTQTVSSPSSSTASRFSHVSQSLQSLKFDSIFNQGFGPSALLFPAPTFTTSMNYGEGLNPSHMSNESDDPFTISRPTIELPLDEILNNVDSPSSSVSEYQDNDTQPAGPSQQQDQSPQPVQRPLSPQQPVPQAQMQPQHDIIMRSVAPASSMVAVTKRRTRKSSVPTRDDGDSDEETNENTGTSSVLKNVSTASQAVKETTLPETVAPSKLNPLFTTTAVTRTNLSTRPTLTVKTQTATRSSGPGATATSLSSTSLRNSAPGGVKAECSNCGATHTPLWRRGLNDELNCNACGLYCKLHKRPRPKSMRNNHGEGRTQAVPRQDPVDVMGECNSIGSTRGRSTNATSPVAQTAQCYNCHTTATPLWRKDDEGKTVCNA
jgi:hypothetical protein